MAVATRIGWCHHTFSPWRGCTKVSEGCARCYAEALSKRNPAVLGEWGDDGVRAMAAESAWKEVYRWDRAAHDAGERRRVFFSLGDPFEDRPELVKPRVRLFHAISETPHLDWLLLTKRPENIRRFYGGHGVPRSWAEATPPNLWLGVSCENQKRFNERVPLLQAVPAAVRFLSIEPILGPIDFHDHDESWATFDVWRGRQIDWVIVGGESGPGRRECEIGWLEDIASQCRDACVPLFVKQDSGPRDGMQGRIPDDLWALKQFPRERG